ncbi:MAG: hypothetical protein NXY57DRAFT_968536 [Lentinula lateritia]|nr:MAG: hypothetical protein NXY57DRAFT_968536 [Lentinula lateritia]
MSEIHNYDVLIVGAGFAGVHQLLNVRKLGLTLRPISNALPIPMPKEPTPQPILN